MVEVEVEVEEVEVVVEGEEITSVARVQVAGLGSVEEGGAVAVHLHGVEVEVGAALLER